MIILILTSSSLVFVLLYAYLTLYRHVRDLRSEFNIGFVMTLLHHDQLTVTRDLLLLHHAYVQHDYFENASNADITWEEIDASKIDIMMKEDD